MTARVVATLAMGLISAVYAPMQCTHDPDPSVRQEDAAGDALWDLASDFKSRGDESAYRHTLETLVARYPQNRHALVARDEIRDAGK